MNVPNPIKAAIVSMITDYVIKVGPPLLEKIGVIVADGLKGLSARWKIRDDQSHKVAQKLVTDVRETGNRELLARIEAFASLVDEQRQVERTETKKALADLEARIESLLKKDIEALPSSIVETDKQLTERIKLFS
jgi:histidinol dehydrogenase